MHLRPSRRILHKDLIQTAFNFTLALVPCFGREHRGQVFHGDGFALKRRGFDFLVIVALIPIATASLAAVGYDDLINIWFFCCTITPGFISLAVMLRTKKSLLRQTAFSCCLSALLGGISEPTTYGICYKMVRPYYAYLITALSTAVLAGLLHLKCYAFGGYSLTNILLYLGPNLDYANFRNALLLVGFMLIMSFITVNLIGFDDSCYEETAVAAQDAAE